MSLFVWVHFLIVCAWPLTVFISARWMGFAPWTALLAAALAPLVATEGLYGLEYGYAAALSLVLLAFLEAPRRLRILRVALVGAVAVVVTAPILVPLLIDMPQINRSHWEAAWKWDSWGAPEVLSRLAGGGWLDAGRFPSLSLLALLGTLAVLGGLGIRQGWLRPVADRWLKLPSESQPACRFALAGAILWLALLCGRPTWGAALGFLGLGELTHLHRLIGPLHFFLVLLAALGLRRLWVVAATGGPPRRWLVAGASFLLLLPAVHERATFLRENQQWGEANRAAHEAEATHLGTILQLVKGETGRIYPGLGGGWGSDFRVGWVPLSAHLSHGGIPALAYLYHSMSLPGDLMVHFDERRPEHFRLFNVSSVLAPQGRSFAPFLQPTARSGRFQIWRPAGGEASGYLDLVVADQARRVDRSNFYEVNKRWMDGPGPGQRRHLRLYWQGEEMVGGSPDPLDGVPTERDLGTLHWQEERDGIYRTHVTVEAPCFLLFKMSYHPNWQARVDGAHAPTVRLSPGFVGVALAVPLRVPYRSGNSDAASGRQSGQLGPLSRGDLSGEGPPRTSRASAEHGMADSRHRGYGSAGCAYGDARL